MHAVLSTTSSNISLLHSSTFKIPTASHPESSANTLNGSLPLRPVYAQPVVDTTSPVESSRDLDTVFASASSRSAAARDGKQRATVIPSIRTRTAEIAFDTAPSVRVIGHAATAAEGFLDSPGIDCVSIVELLDAGVRVGEVVMVICTALLLRASLAFADSALELAEEIANGVEREGNGDEGYGDGEADSEHVFAYIRDWQRRSVAIR